MFVGTRRKPQHSSSLPQALHTPMLLARELRDLNHTPLPVPQIKPGGLIQITFFQPPDQVPPAALHHPGWMGTIDQPRASLLPLDKVPPLPRKLSRQGELKLLPFLFTFLVLESGFGVGLFGFRLGVFFPTYF